MNKRISLYLFISILYLTVNILFFCTIIRSPVITRCDSLFKPLLALAIVDLILVAGFVVFFYLNERKKIKEYQEFNPLKEEEFDIENEEGPFNRNKKQTKFNCKNDICKSLTFWWILLLGVLSLIMIITMSIWVNYYNKTMDRDYGDFEFSEILNNATIYRESNGLIHIRSDNMHDLFFAQGYASAQDRLFQMDLHRRIGAGTLSELVGKEGLKMDKLFRTLNFR